MSAAYLDVRNKSSADPQSLVSRDIYKWAISAALLGGTVSRTADYVLGLRPAGQLFCVAKL